MNLCCYLLEYLYYVRFMLGCMWGRVIYQQCCVGVGQFIERGECGMVIGQLVVVDWIEVVQQGQYVVVVQGVVFGYYYQILVVCVDMWIEDLYYFVVVLLQFLQCVGCLLVIVDCQCWWCGGQCCEGFVVVLCYVGQLVWCQLLLWCVWVEYQWMMCFQF